jgi:hypothetical protein
MLRMVATDNRRFSTRPSEIAAQERDAGAFDRYIRAADHGDAAAFGAQPLHHLALLLGEYAGLDLIDTKLGGQRARSSHCRR